MLMNEVARQTGFFFFFWNMFHNWLFTLRTIEELAGLVRHCDLDGNV